MFPSKVIQMLNEQIDIELSMYANEEPELETGVLEHESTDIFYSEDEGAWVADQILSDGTRTRIAVGEDEEYVKHMAKELADRSPINVRENKMSKYKNQNPEMVVARLQKKIEIMENKKRSLAKSKGVKLDEDWGSSDEGALVRGIDDSLKRAEQAKGFYSLDDIEAAIHNGADFYGDMMGYDSYEATFNAVKNAWLRRSDIGSKWAQMFAPVSEAVAGTPIEEAMPIGNSEYAERNDLFLADAVAFYIEDDMMGREEAIRQVAEEYGTSYEEVEVAYNTVHAPLAFESSHVIKINGLLEMAAKAKSKGRTKIAETYKTEANDIAKEVGYEHWNDITSFVTSFRKLAEESSMWKDAWKNFWYGSREERKQEQSNKDAFNQYRVDKLTQKFIKQGQDEDTARANAYRTVFPEPAMESIEEGKLDENLNNRQMWIPTDGEEVKDTESSAVVYKTTAHNGKPAAYGFSGRRGKPDFRYYYNSEEERQKKIDAFFKSVREREAYTKQRRTPNPRTIEVGDIVYTSWGYSMTIVDFYQVTKLIGKSSAEVIEISAETVDGDAGYSGHLMPNKDDFVGTPIRVRFNGDTAKVEGQYARPWGGKPVYFNRMD